VACINVRSNVSSLRGSLQCLCKLAPLVLLFLAFTVGTVGIAQNLAFDSQSSEMIKVIVVLRDQPLHVEAGFAQAEYRDDLENLASQIREITGLSLGEGISYASTEEEKDIAANQAPSDISTETTSTPLSDSPRGAT